MDVGQTKEFTYVGGTDPYVFQAPLLDEALRLKPDQINGVSVLKLNEKCTIIRQRLNTYTVLSGGN